MKATRRGETVSSRHPQVFSEDTSAKTGFSERSIQQDIQIATELDDAEHDWVLETRS
jgi:hypothetical protein